MPTSWSGSPAEGALVTGRRRARRVDEYRPGWTRSMRGERMVARRSGVLDRVMIGSVAVAAVAFAVWLFGFAGSSLPH